MQSALQIRLFVSVGVVTGGCSTQLFPATSEREKISFRQLNKKTCHRIRYKKVDAESGHEVAQEDIIKGYEAHKGSDTPPASGNLVCAVVGMPAATLTVFLRADRRSRS